MQILSVTLSNFKTHKDKQFEFQLGTNAICGENGAGKTSILEAIAWVLFNYQGSYRKEDLIRNGASSAQARVSFISSRDSRTYEVQRSTSQGYTLFDPQLNERLPYTHTKNEVLPWLRQHLGVSSGTDLSQLFANTIGVPQGTFTVDFLLPTEKRKPIFDTVLKVEEYRETYKQSNSLRKYSEAQSQRLKDLIEQYDQLLQGWDELQVSHQKLQTEIQLDEHQLSELEQKIQKLSAQKKVLKETAEEIQRTKVQHQQIAGQIKAQARTKQQSEATLTAAQQAENICKATKPDYEAFLSVEVQINKLTEESKNRQVLSQQYQQSQQNLRASQSALLRLSTQLEQFEEAEKELASLAVQVASQTKLEGQKTTIQKQIQSFTNIRFQQKELMKQAEQLNQEAKQIETELVRIVALQQTATQIPEWEEQQNKIQVQLSRIVAARQFEHELRALAERGQIEQDDYRQQVAAALKTMERWVGQFEALEHEAIAPIKETLFQGGLLSKSTIETLNGILSDLAAQTNQPRLEKQQRVIQQNLQQAYVHRGEFIGIEQNKIKHKQINHRQSEIQKTLVKLNQKLTSESTLTEQLAQVDRQIETLGNPKGFSQLLVKSLQQKEAVSQQYQDLQAVQKKRIEKGEAIAHQLKTFEQLEDKMHTQQQAKQAYQTGYLDYLKNQQAAQQVEPLAQKVQLETAEMTQLTTQQAKLADRLESLSQRFDAEAFTTLDKHLSEANSQADRLRGSLPQQQQRLVALSERIDELKATAEKRDQAQAELKARDRVKRFISYARKVYKAAGPRITERYVHNISREADRLFRELLGRQNVALTWSADYEITVQEGAHTRRFINLSGGEQMCAALSVRLALLKVLADIDVAFFDEPTTNMDKARRASLADAIARIKSFNQLFVISHDDTFEQVTETVITVTRDV